MRLTLNKGGQLNVKQVMSTKEDSVAARKIATGVLAAFGRWFNDTKDNINNKASIGLIQNLFRGHHVRSTVIYPSEIQSFLKTNMPGLSQTDIENYSHLIGHHSVNMLKDPALYKKGIRLQKGKDYTIGSKTFKLPRTIWLNLSKDGNFLQVQFYGMKIGKGSYKICKGSKTLVVTLQQGILQVQKPKQIKETILARSKHLYDAYLYSKKEIKDFHKEDVENMKKPILLVSKSFTKSELKNPKLKVAGIPNKFRTYEGTNGLKLEWQEPRFLGDADVMAKKNLLSSEDKLNIIDNVSHTLGLFHKKGLVHNDVKLANILVRRNSDKRAEGYVTDYDLTTTIKEQLEETNYPYWDRCANNTITLPTTDTHGLAISLGQSVISPDFWKITKRKSPQDSFSNGAFRKLTKDFISSIRNQGEKKQIQKYISGKLTTSYDFSWEKNTKNVEDNLAKMKSDLIKKYPKHSQQIKQFIADLYLVTATFPLVFEVLKAGNDVYKHLKANPNLYAKLKDPGTSAKVLKDLYTLYPIYKNFGKRVEEMKSKYNEWKK